MKNSNGVSLEVEFAGIKFSNPLVLASGVLGTEAELMARVADTGLGAVTTKSCGIKPRLGHENPTVVAWEAGLLNAVGLTNPGVDEEIKEINRLRKLLLGKETKIIASFFGATVDEFVKVARRLGEAKPDLLEMNISCPNVESEQGRMFAASCVDTEKVVAEVKKVVGRVPLVVKLSPNVTDIVEVALSAEAGGADGLCLVNTMLGMIIDVEAGKPILTNKVGGVSGLAIKPVAVRCVWQVAQRVKIPIIGTGGVGYGRDALEMIMAGATLVGIGSATYDRGIEVFTKVTNEMTELMEKNGYIDLESIRGVAYA